MRRKRALLAGSMLCLLFALGPSIADADNPPDYDIAQGHFFTQAAGAAKGSAGSGYSITDDGGIPMWSEYVRLGGVDALGYPISGRLIVGGHVVQLSQKVGLVWLPEANQVRFLNIFSLLHDAGKDPWLTTKGIPLQASWPDEAGKAWQDVSQKRYKLLDTNPSIKGAYFAVVDPVNMYGLPISNWLDTPQVSVLRFERVAFQQWKQPMPWAIAGQVQIANGGDLLKESGIFGQTPFVAQATPPPALQVVPAGFAVISYYADSFQGQHMSDGHVFLQERLTAASNAFPLGARLRLWTTDGKRSITVMNEDHPPAWNPRIDLSKAAFQALYPLSSGVASVKVEIIQ